MMMSQRGALSRDDAADYISLGISKLDELLTAGEIDKVKIGRRTVVPVKSLDAYIEANLVREEQS